MPNGGPDNCGTCYLNDKRGVKEEGYCKIRKFNVINPYWTYCANHQRHMYTEIPLGPVFSSFRFYERIPMYKGEIARENQEVVCSICDKKNLRGITISDLSFCSKKHYLEWWSDNSPEIKLYNCDKDHYHCQFRSTKNPLK